MPFKLISATPSPFARMNRIAMAEKGIPFDLENEIPWHKAETQTPKYNPLEKLSILLDPENPNFEPVYDSAHIQEYIVQKYADKEPKLLIGDVDLDLKARQIQVLSEGVLDAFVLIFFEISRVEDKQSKEWADRQNRKIDGGMRAFEELVKTKKGEYLIGDGKAMTIADIAVACAVGQIDFIGTLRPGWKEQYPKLAEWYTGMDERENFRETRPVMFDIKTDTVV